MLGVSDCIAYSNQPAIPQPTEWQRIRDQIDAAMIFKRADFVNVHHFAAQEIPYLSRKPCSEREYFAVLCVTSRRILRITSIDGPK
jgi:hypothetical protein